MKTLRALALMLTLALLLPVTPLLGSAALAEEPMEISFCFWDLEEFGNDEVGQKIQEDLNIKLNVMAMDWGNEIEMKLLWAASDSLPDIISTYTVEEDISRFYSWQTEGLTRPIPEEMIAKYPRIAEIVANNDIVQFVKEHTGNIAFIPRPFSMYNTYEFDQGCGFFYRKDWLANVGLEKEPTTVAEYYEMLRRFTFEDPDGNGLDDTYGLLLNGGVAQATFSWWGVNPQDWVKTEDGTWMPNYLTDAVLEPVTFINKIYHEGMIDPEYVTNSNSTSLQKFASGNFGVFFKNVDDMSIYNVVLKQFAPAQGIEDIDEAVAKIGILPPIVNNEGDTPVWPAIMDTSGIEVSAKVSDEKLEKILELLEYLMQPDIQRMTRFGFEGREYTLDGDKVVPIINEATGLAYNISAIYPSSRIYALPTWDIDTDLANDVIPPSVKELGQKVRDEFNPVATPMNMLIFTMSTPAKDSTSVDLKAGFNNLVTMEGDVEAALHNWQQELLLRGMDQVVAEVNAKIQEMGIE